MAATDEFVRPVVAAMCAQLRWGDRFLPLFSRRAGARPTIRFRHPARKFGSISRFRTRGLPPVAARHPEFERVEAEQRFLRDEYRLRVFPADRSRLWR